MGRARGANAQLLLKNETTYGVAATGNYQKMSFLSDNFDGSQALIDDDTLGQGRDVSDPGFDAIDVDGDITVPVCLNQFPVWLKLALGAPVTTTVSTGVYKHTFSSGASSLPSASLELGSPEVPSFNMRKGSMIDQVKIALTRKGWLNATLSLIGQSYAEATSSGGGTPTTLAQQRLSQLSGSVLKDGVALANITAADLMFKNSLDRLEEIRADGFIGGCDPSEFRAEANITSRFANTTLLDLALSKTPCEIKFGWSLSGTAYVTVTLHRVFFPKPKKQYSSAGGIDITFAARPARDATAGKMMTIEVVNSIATY